jgi:hypothetical protein
MEIGLRSGTASPVAAINFLIIGSAAIQTLPLLSAQRY